MLGLYFSKKIVAVSKSTKKDLLNFFPSSKIKVIYTPVKEKKLKIKKIKKTKKFLLHLGSIFYKNRIMALKIFNEISKKKLNYVLRCTGKLNKEEKSFLENKKISDKVEVFNNISEIKKKKLFQTSDILLVTSSDEGYGFPLLEAYNLDLPVLTSNKGSLKEISNGFSVIKKYTVDSFVKKILLLDKNNSYKKQIIKNNKKILKKINDLNEYKLFYRKIYIDTIKA